MADLPKTISAAKTGKAETNAQFRERCDREKAERLARLPAARKALADAVGTSSHDSAMGLVKDLEKEINLCTMYGSMTDPQIKILRLFNPELKISDSRESSLYDYSLCAILADGSLHPSWSAYVNALAEADQHIKPFRKSCHLTAYSIAFLIQTENKFDSAKIKTIMVHSGHTQAANVGKWAAIRHGFNTAKTQNRCRMVTVDLEHPFVKMIRDSKIEFVSMVKNPPRKADQN